MEGPSLFLAAEQLAPFVGKKILSVSGNSTIGIERLEDQRILDIFSYGKYLFFQFETFALRIHFMLYGSFQAVVDHVKVTGDYPKKARTPRLALSLKNGEIEMYSCSVRFIEESDAKAQCDYSIDIMSDEWDGRKVLAAVKKEKESEIADVLLDQTIFLGVGNIIKNEVLVREKIAPTRLIANISAAKLKKIVELTREYVFQFYEWRKKFELRKHYLIYRQSLCKQCGNKVLRKKTGQRNRVSFICPKCSRE